LANSIVVRLCGLIVLLAIAAAGSGLFTHDGGAPCAFTTVRGETAKIYGQGLYRYDSLMAGSGQRGVDLVTLLFGVPLLVAATLRYQRRSARGRLLLSGALAYFLYVYATLSFGTAFNALFLVYVALFGASFYALILLVATTDIPRLTSHLADGLPHRGIGAFLIASGVLTLAIWLEAPLTSFINGHPPTLLGHSTTLVTHALDLAIIVPGAFIAGALVLRRDPRGYLIAFPLLTLMVMLVPAIIAMTVSQLQAGIVFTTAEWAGPISGFLILGGPGIWIAARGLRRIPDGEES
jgi:hypothetical protein